MSLNLGLSDTSSLLDSGYAFFGRKYHRSDDVSFSIHHIRRLIMSICPVSCNVYIGYLVKLASASVFLLQSYCFYLCY